MITRRPFESREAYIHAQGRKARDEREAASWQTRRPESVRSFLRTFRAAHAELLSGPVLCLGARTGAENEAAAAAGFEGSVGLDLYPAGPNVVQGDWHAMPFPDAFFPNVYSNSFDHCLDLEQATAEIRRVLQPAGRFYLMASDRSGKPDAQTWLASRNSNEAIYWERSEDLCAAVCDLGFHRLRCWKAGVWGHFILQAEPRHV